MANLFFNDLTISGERGILEQIKLYVTADVLWAAEPELEPGNLTDLGTQLQYRYDTKGGCSVDCIESLAHRFPDAYILLTFKNDNESVYGYVEYAYGVELRGQLFEDCGGY